MHLRLLFLLIALLAAGCTTNRPGEFVTVRDGRFILDGEPYYFVGTNFWYAPLLASQGPGGDRARLARELDALCACGVDNLRILVGAEGPEGVPLKIAPTLQPAPGEYNDALLDGLDYLMRELDARGMKAVLYLTNAWDWSGGYNQYLEWAGAGPAPVPTAENWQTYSRYSAQFIASERAKALYADHVRFIVGRTNRYTGRAYKDDPAIFSWQIANEPRAFSPENKEAFAAWIGSTARLIRSIDPNHLISTGSEGLFGCEVDTLLTERIHAFAEIDYLNLHVWPYNWRWVGAGSLADDLVNALEQTENYLDLHLAIARRLRKPAVVEEFGFPRDSFRFERGTPTTLRDTYYRYLLDRVVASRAEGDVLAGCNFWGWGGEARPPHLYWQPGDAYTGDPAQEQQGLNSVFDDDATVSLVRSANEALRGRCPARKE